MRNLPGGTVTFLFTDIEGSTRLLKDLGGRYADVLAEHERILREAFARGGGQEIDTQGDSFFVAFPRAKDAVGAALGAQRGLRSHEWPHGGHVRVRMGLHTGEPTVGGERYVGLGVHRTARICAAAHGGQVLLSNTTRDIVEDELPTDARLVDLGEHKLKDIDRPERLFQLNAEGLPSRFPPLRVDAPLPRSRFRAGRFARPRLALLAVGALLALAGLIAGIALALGGGSNPRAAETGVGPNGHTSPGRDPGKVVPGRSIGSVSLGMSESDAKKLYGDGVETEWRSPGKSGSVLRFSGPEAALSAALFAGKVVQVSTASSHYATGDGIRVGTVAPYPGVSQARTETALHTGELVRLPSGAYAWRDFIYGRNAYCLRDSRTVTQLTLDLSEVHVLRILVTDVRFEADLPSRVSQQGEGVTSFNGKC